MLSAKKIFIYGAGSHARVILDIVEKGREPIEVFGLVDDTKSENEVCGYPVFSTLEEVLARGITSGIVAIGDNWTRSQVVARILDICSSLEFVSAIHPSAQIGPDVAIGPGTAVMAGVVININTRIGSHCIVNTSASVDHDNVLGDFSSIGPGAVLGGNVHVDRLSAVALGASVSNDLRIGARSVVGVGSAVLRDVPEGVIAYGVPCRVIRSRREDEPYLVGRK